MSTAGSTQQLSAGFSAGKTLAADNLLLQQGATLGKEMQQYHLSPHVRMCISSDAAILLDLRHDEYLGLSPLQARTVGRSIAGWPSEQFSETATATEASQGSQALIDILVQKGLVTTVVHNGGPTQPVALPEANLVLVDKQTEPAPVIGAEHISNFFLAHVRARFFLRTHSLDRIVQRMQKRKTAAPPMGDRQLVMRNMTLTFLRLRPFVYSASNRCLLDSLTLLEFLAMYAIYPTWIIGVTAKPFAAHSWVQHQQCVLNGDPAYVRRFQRILTI